MAGGGARRGRAKAPDPGSWRARTDAELLTPGAWRARAAAHHLVGVMGYAGRWRDEAGDPIAARKADARRLLGAELRRAREAHGERLIMVSGATQQGVLEVAYALCVELSIVAAGVTAERALAYGLAPMALLVCGGRNFGDESALFVETCHEFIVLGGGDQSRREAVMAASQGKPVTLIRGFGGAADALGPGEVPTARIVERRAV
ncbi:MAG: hypothetical protein R3B09_11850 [Nannocystaceae bacterium]